MAKKYLDGDGLLYFWQKIKSAFVTDVTYDSTNRKIQKTKNGSTSDVVTLATVATSGSYNDLSNKPTIPSGVEKSTTTPKMDGTASVGTETKFAAGDHIHPSDTSRVPTTRTINGLDLTANRNIIEQLGSVSSGGHTMAVYKDGTDSEHTHIIYDQTAVDGILAGANAIVAQTYVPKTTTVNGHALSADVTVTASDIGVEDGAEVNQNAFSNVKVGATTVAADAKTDTLELVAGSNVTITPDATNDKITIAATDTKYTAASASPLMDGTAAVGSSAKYAREDHVHPTDTSRQVDLGITDVGIAPTGGLNYFVIRLTNDDTISLPTDDTLLSVWEKLEELDTNIDGKVNTSSVGAAAGVCPLDANSKVDSQYLPSYVDDVVEAYARSGQTALSQNWLATGSATGTVITPEAGKIYILMADSGDYAANSQFRWSGTTYVKMADGGVSSITNSEIDTIVAA